MTHLNIISLYIVNRMAFVKEVDYVSCVVQMEALYINYVGGFSNLLHWNVTMLNDTQDLYSFSIFTAYSEYVTEWPVCQLV